MRASVINARSNSIGFRECKYETEKAISAALQLSTILVLFPFFKILESISNRRISYIQRLIFTIVIFAMICVSSSLYFGEPQQMVEAEIYVWTATLLGSIMYSIAARRVRNILYKFCFDYMTHGALIDFQSTVKYWYSPKKKLLITSIISIVMTAFLAPSFYIATSVFTLPSYFAALLVSSIVGSWIYGACFMAVYANFLRKNEKRLDLYSLNPASSVLSKNSLSIVETIAVFIPPIISLYIPLLFMIGPNTYYFNIGLGILSFTTILVFGFLFWGNYILSQVIKHRRHKIISGIQRAIQDKINGIYINSSSNQETDLDRLISIHDMVLRTSNQTIAFGNILRVSASLSAPILLFLLGSVVQIALGVIMQSHMCNYLPFASCGGAVSTP